jgi:TonB family protein
MSKIAAFSELVFSALCVALVCQVPVLVADQAAGTGSPPTVIAAVAPTYPGIALAMPNGGGVTVEISIGPDGKVSDTKVVSGAAPLRHPALEAARLWRFAPEDAGKKATLVFSFKVMPKDTSAEDLTPIFRPPYGVEVRRTMPVPVVNYGG